MTLRLGIFVTHPIQYFAPMWRMLARTPGLETTVHFFSDHSVRGGYDKELGQKVAWDVPMLDDYNHCFITRDADLSRPHLVGIPQAASYLRQGRFDWVMIHGYTHRFERQVVHHARAGGYRVLQRGEFSDVERYGSPRGWIRRAVRNTYLRWFYRQVDAFCYIGKESQEHLRRYGVTDKQMSFSPYSVDSDLFGSFHESISCNEARRSLCVEPDQTVLLFSGKMISRKAPLLLLDAIEQLPNREQLTLIMLGSGELYHSVLRRGEKLLGKRFIAPGFVNQRGLGRYFRAADIFVHPSRSETWGLVVNEAMQCELPVVVGRNVGCRRDLVLEGETGFSFPDGDVAALARVINRLASKPNLTARLGKNARSHISTYSTHQSASGILTALGLHPAIPFSATNRTERLTA